MALRLVMVGGAVARPSATTIRKSEVYGRYVIIARPPCAGGVTEPLYPRAAPVILGVGSQSASRGHVAPELVGATPGGDLPGNVTAIGSHSVARRCGPASLERAVSQVAALLWYQRFGHDASLLHDCGLSSTIRVLKLKDVCPL